METRKEAAAGCNTKATNIKMMTLSQSLNISGCHAFTWFEQAGKQRTRMGHLSSQVPFLLFLQMNKQTQI